SIFLRAPSPADTAPLSLHDALPICGKSGRNGGAGGGSGGLVLMWAGAITAAGQIFANGGGGGGGGDSANDGGSGGDPAQASLARSEEHTSELQSQSNLVCRLLLEKK